MSAKIRAVFGTHSGPEVVREVITKTTFSLIMKPSSIIMTTFLIITTTFFLILNPLCTLEMSAIPPAFFRSLDRSPAGASLLRPAKRDYGGGKPAPSFGKASADKRAGKGWQVAEFNGPAKVP